MRYKLVCCCLLAVCGLLWSCSAEKNTATTRWWQGFTAKYNTYYNGSLAYIDGCVEKEKGNQDNYTEIIPLYTVSNKKSASLGKGNFDRAIEKCEKTIKQHSIKKRPVWTKSGKKTAKDIEWLSRREYNPFLWKAWYMMGRSQFMQGEFEAAAATFSYMSHMYATQPKINGLAKAWLAKCYAEYDWFYEAEDVIRGMRRDSISRKVQKELDGALADYHLRQQHFEEAEPYLMQVIKHETRRKQKAREYFLLGQIETQLGNNEKAYKAYSKVVGLHPPYQLAFNARIAQTEVIAKDAKKAKSMISKLKRMARNDNNKDYLDQVYYAIGNIYLAQNDTTKAIESYEKGAEKATRSGVEKGVLLLKLGNIYWEQEKYSDAQRCYGEAIGLLDKERPDYEELSERSKVLDELVPYTDAIHLQDSLQVLAKMDSTELLKVIDQVIKDLIKKEKEEEKKAKEAAVEQQLAKQQAQGNNMKGAEKPAQNTPTVGNGQWYFYNQQAIMQGKTQFQRLWGKRENKDDWQRTNITNVASSLLEGETTDSLDAAPLDSLQADAAVPDSLQDKAQAEFDSLAQDPHKREYYLAQIPFTEEQVAASNMIIMDGLYNSGVIFKDKLDKLDLCKKAFTRLETQYPTYEKMADLYYHSFLLYSRLGMPDSAATYVTKLQESYPDNEWTLILSDPYFADNQRFGKQMEDSLYAATYEAFKAGGKDTEVKANAEISEKRFPQGDNRSKFLFIDGLRMLDEGNSKGCLENMKTIVEKFPQSELAKIAGSIVNGVSEGKKLHGGGFDTGSIWERRSVAVQQDDSVAVREALSDERYTRFIFMIAYPQDSINENQLLYDLAKYNFTNFLVRSFDIEVEHDAGMGRMIIGGFLSFDEAWQYSHQLTNSKQMEGKLKGTRVILISEDNFELLGTHFSYNDYDEFYRKHFAPLKISNEDLLQIPEEIQYRELPDDGENEGEEQNADTTEDWELF